MAGIISCVDSQTIKRPTSPDEYDGIRLQCSLWCQCPEALNYDVLGPPRPESPILFATPPDDEDELEDSSVTADELLGDRGDEVRGLNQPYQLIETRVCADELASCKAQIS